MEVNDPDLDAFESATHAQLRARELGKARELGIHLGDIFIPEVSAIQIIRRVKPNQVCSSIGGKGMKQLAT